MFNIAFMQINTVRGYSAAGFTGNSGSVMAYGVDLDKGNITVQLP